MCFGSGTASAAGNAAVSTDFHYAGDHAGDDTDAAIVAKTYGADSAYAATYLTVL